MTEPSPELWHFHLASWRRGMFVLLRVTLSLVALFVTYFLLPVRSRGGGAEVFWLVIELLIFGAVVGIQVPAIVRSRHPILRAVEAVAILIPLYLLIFARIYLANSLSDPSGFTRQLDTTTALYFTVTVFATVGFGDIVANTNSMRLLVTAQMILNLVILGLVIRLMVSAARRGVARRGAVTDLGDPPDLTGQPELGTEPEQRPPGPGAGG